MATAINVLIIHGVGWGESGKDFSRPLQEGLRREFGKAVKNLKLRDVARADMNPQTALRFEPVDWAQVTQLPQNALLQLIFGRWGLLRRFNPTFLARKNMVGLLGDVIAYEAGSEVYQAIHRRVDQGVERLSEESSYERDESGMAPLTIIGHSLGSVIGSDFVWDNTQHHSSEPHIMGDHHMSLVNYIALGSPMILYALRNNAGGRLESIRSALSAPIQVAPEGGLWLNLYDQQDVIAFPLRVLRSYADAGVIDLKVSSGNWLTGWNPACHVGYWSSGNVARWIARKLALDWARYNSPEFAERDYARSLKKLRREMERA